MDIAGQVEIFDDRESLTRHAAERIADAMRGCAAPYRFCLAGGSTPQPIYRLLAQRNDIAWDCVEIFFGDERVVPHDHADSNYRMAKEALFSGANVHPRLLAAIPTDGTAEACAEAYAEELRQQYGASVLDPAVPLFDLMLMGLGSDGHTASLLPGQPVLEERTRWVAPAPKGREVPRVTLTYPAMESSRLMLFLVAGADKAEAVKRVRAGDPAFPAGRLKPVGQVVWMLDRAAAGLHD